MAELNPSIAPPSAPIEIAQWVMSQTESVLSNAINEPMQALFEALMPVIVVGLTLQFVVYAFALMHGQSNMTVTEFFRKAILVVIISMLFGVGGLSQADRKSVVSGKSVSERVDLGGRRIIKTTPLTTHPRNTIHSTYKN